MPALVILLSHPHSADTADSCSQCVAKALALGVSFKHYEIAVIGLLKTIMQAASSAVEIRFQRRNNFALTIENGKTLRCEQGHMEGVAIRSSYYGGQGFACTHRLDETSLRQTLLDAISCGQSTPRELTPKTTFRPVDPCYLARGHFIGPDVDVDYASAPSDHVHLIRTLCLGLQNSPRITLARVRFNQMREECSVLSSDGADASYQIIRTEISASLIAENRWGSARIFRSAGVCGGLATLLQHPSFRLLLHQLPQLAVDLIDAPAPQQGAQQCILTPALVGLLCHEAIGHAAEGDFVRAGSFAQRFANTRVAPEQVTVVDNGWNQEHANAAGSIPFDDEGILCQPVTLIDAGILSGRLNNRSLARLENTPPTGNARAWSPYVEPRIRMRNTYLLPGTSTLDEIIASTQFGYLLAGSGAGQADTSGDFTFSSTHGWEIQDGKVRRLIRGPTIGGNALNCLQSINAISNGFQFDLGSGFCHKTDPIKVDAGGPHVRCQLAIA